MKVLICGGRDFTNKRIANDVLDRFHAETPITEIVQGGARGADSLARDWAHQNKIPNKTYPANWDRDKKAAGPIRNAFMLKDSDPDLVIAFPGGRGTAHMVMVARKALKRVVEVEYDD